MKRVLSGIKPSGEITLGNYVGAMKRWADTQDGTENFYFIPNLHALNYRPEPAELVNQTLNAVAWLLVMGVDPDKSVIFAQSQVPEHSELCWVLNNYVTMGELSRMTQFKDKSHRRPEGQVVGLFDYPVLMAADILLYDADEVPVGDDQKQHVELTRDIAERFNNKYGLTFKLPEPTIQAVGARVMNLQDPTRKMDKTDADSAGVILMSDNADVISGKIKRAVTDSGDQVKQGDDKPAITNLLQIYAVLSGQSVSDIETQYHGRGYGDFKSDLTDLVITTISPLQKQFDATRRDEAALRDVLKQGQAQAHGLAVIKMSDVKAKLGLL